MNTNDVTTFLRIYEAKSLSRAAQSLFISPQGLSKIVQRLENELGVTLFIRSTRGLSPTKNADDFYEMIKPLMKKFEAITQSFSSKQSNEVLKIIYTLGYFQFLSLDLVTSFKEQYTNVELVLDERTDDDVQTGVLEKQFDIGIMTGPAEHPDLNSSFLCSLEHVLILNENDPLVEKEYLSFGDLNEKRLALLSYHCHSRKTFMSKLEHAGAIPKEIYESDLLDVNHLRASQFGCIAHSIRPFADNYLHLYKNTVLRRFDDKTFLWNTHFVWRKDRTLPESANSFINYTYDWIKKPGNTMLDLAGIS